MRRSQVFSFCKPFGVADQMRQTGLTQPHPFRVNAIAIADQNALPILDQLQYEKRFRLCD